MTPTSTPTAALSGGCASTAALSGGCASTHGHGPLVAWFRLADLSRTVRAAVPPSADGAVHALTYLGDGLVLGPLLVVALLVWRRRRREVAVLLAVAVGTYLLTLGLKALFALPRPPVAVRPVAIDPDFYGFPSGHATMATTVYGGLLAVREDYRTPVGVGCIVLVIGGVALSRVALGVHYLGDVLVGVAVGTVAVGVVAAVANVDR